MPTIEATPPPIAEHPRFVESSPEITEKLGLLTEGIQELQQINPEIVGAGLFGSTLKGEATAQSDYDTSVFLDAGQLHTMGVEVAPWVTSQNEQTATLKIADPSLEKEYKAYLGKYLAKKLGDDPATVEGGIFLVPISKDIIDNQLSTFYQHAEKYLAYRNTLDQWLDRENVLDETDPPEYTDADPDLGNNIGSLFRAELTPGLEDYRTYILKSLKDHGDLGELAWKDIKDTVLFGEGHLDETQYPANVDEALQTYGIET